MGPHEPSQLSSSVLCGLKSRTEVAFKDWPGRQERYCLFRFLGHLPSAWPLFCSLLCSDRAGVLRGSPHGGHGVFLAAKLGLSCDSRVPHHSSLEGSEVMGLL